MMTLWAVALILALFAAALAVACRRQGDVDRRLSAISDARIVARADAQQAAIMRGDLMVGIFGDYPPAAPFDKEWEPALPQQVGVLPGAPWLVPVDDDDDDPWLVPVFEWGSDGKVRTYRPR